MQHFDLQINAPFFFILHTCRTSLKRRNLQRRGKLWKATTMMRTDDDDSRSNDTSQPRVTLDKAPMFCPIARLSLRQHRHYFVTFHLHIFTLLQTVCTLLDAIKCAFKISSALCVRSHAVTLTPQCQSFQWPVCCRCVCLSNGERVFAVQLFQQAPDEFPFGRSHDVTQPVGKACSSVDWRLVRGSYKIRFGVFIVIKSGLPTLGANELQQ